MINIKKTNVNKWDLNDIDSLISSLIEQYVEQTELIFTLSHLQLMFSTAVGSPSTFAKHLNALNVAYENAQNKKHMTLLKCLLPSSKELQRRKYQATKLMKVFIQEMFAACLSKSHINLGDAMSPIQYALCYLYVCAHTYRPKYDVSSLCLLFSGPSSVGKSTLIEGLLQERMKCVQITNNSTSTVGIFQPNSMAQTTMAANDISLSALISNSTYFNWFLCISRSNTNYSKVVGKSTRNREMWLLLMSNQNANSFTYKNRMIFDKWLDTTINPAKVQKALKVAKKPFLNRVLEIFWPKRPELSNLDIFSSFITPSIASAAYFPLVYAYLKTLENLNDVTFKVIVIQAWWCLYKTKTNFLSHVYSSEYDIAHQDTILTQRLLELRTKFNIDTSEEFCDPDLQQ